MKYPAKFVSEVKREYADRPDVVEAAEAGRYGLGLLLARGASMTMSHEDIISAIDSDKCELVKADAARAIRRRGLHTEWMRGVLKEIAVPSELERKSSPPRRFSVPPPSRRRTHVLYEEARP